MAPLRGASGELVLVTALVLAAVWGQEPPAVTKQWHGPPGLFFDAVTTGIEPNRKTKQSGIN